MSTDTLSPSATSTSAPPLPPATARPAHEASQDARAAADNHVPAIPNPMTVEVLFGQDGRGPILKPHKHHSSKPSQRGYQFARGVTDATLTFEIVSSDGHTFSGCTLSNVVDDKGGEFPMPQTFAYRITGPSTLVVEMTFAPGRVQQVRVEPVYRDKTGVACSFDPQIGNDGGNIHLLHASGDGASVD